MRWYSNFALDNEIQSKLFPGLTVLSVKQGWRCRLNGTHRENFQYKWGEFVSTWHTRPVTHFREPIEWVDTTPYLGVTLDTRLTWSPHIDQVRKRTARRMGMMGPLLNRKIDLSARNGVLLYKQLIRPLMDYACPAWRSAAAPMSGSYDC